MTEKNIEEKKFNGEPLFQGIGNLIPLDEYSVIGLEASQWKTDGVVRSSKLVIKHLNRKGIETSVVGSVSQDGKPPQPQFLKLPLDAITKQVWEALGKEIFALQERARKAGGSSQ